MQALTGVKAQFVAGLGWRFRIFWYPARPFRGVGLPKYEDEWCFSTCYPEKNHSYLTVREVGRESIQKVPAASRGDVNYPEGIPIVHNENNTNRKRTCLQDF